MNNSYYILHFILLISLITYLLSVYFSYQEREDYIKNKRKKLLFLSLVLFNISYFYLSLVILNNQLSWVHLCVFLIINFSLLIPFLTVNFIIRYYNYENNKRKSVNKSLHSNMSILIKFVILPIILWVFYLYLGWISLVIFASLYIIYKSIVHDIEIDSCYDDNYYSFPGVHNEQDNLYSLTNIHDIEIDSCYDDNYYSFPGVHNEQDNLYSLTNIHDIEIEYIDNNKYSDISKDFDTFPLN